MGIFDTGAEEAQRKNEAQLAFIKSLFGDMSDRGGSSAFGQLFRGYDRAGGFMRAMIDEARTGKERATQAVSGAGREAQRAIADRTTQAASGARQRAISSGFGNSTAGITAESQAQYQGARAAGQMGSQLAGLFANTELAGSRGIQSALGSTAQLYAQRGRDMMQGASALGNIVSRYQWQPTQSQFGQFAPLLGAGLGMFAGGPGGAAAGYNLGQQV